MSGLGAVPEQLGIALRAYTEAVEEPASRKGRTSNGRAREWPEPQTVLVFDTETTTDQAQRLNFGVYHYCRWIADRFVCVEETVFYADELPERDPTGYETLRQYVHRNALTTAADPEIDDTSPLLRLISESEFRNTLRIAACDNGSPETAALVAGFSLPFDLSRIALRWGPAESRKYAGGFSLQLWDYEDEDGDRRESPLRPRLGIKHLGSTKALKGFIAPFSAHFLDLRTLVSALTNEKHSLASACKAFGVTGAEDLDEAKRKVEHGKITLEYIDYCREDVRASAELYERAMREYRRHPIPLQATQAYSPASIGKSYLEAMGVRPRAACQPSFSKRVFGQAMSAYYGGRTECRLRRVPVPIVYCDFLSMYTTVNSLMGLWNHVTARRIEAREATDEIRALVERVTVEDCLDPSTWRQLPALVQIRPDGDVLPVRAHYEKTCWNIGSNPLYSEEPLWYALPDVIASKLITGRTPEIIRAIKLVPLGTQRGLQPVKLRGEVEVDPRKEDFFRTVIERRKALPDGNEVLGEFLKVLANSTSYGIYAEMRRRELPGKRSERIIVHAKDELFEVETSTPETPGPVCFPPMAACITAAARLMLAILEALVTESAGTWAFADTDSMAIVATEHGGLIECPGGPARNKQGRECVKALSWDEVGELVRRFETLNPYDRAKVPGSVLEIEKENYQLDSSDPQRKRVLKDRRRQLYCYAISAKRYALYNLDDEGQPILRRVVDDDENEDEPADHERTDVLEELRKVSEHGLGHLLNPTDPEDPSRHWIDQLWEHIVRTDAHGLESIEPAWLDRPAITRSAVTTWELQRRFETYNEGKPNTAKVRPYNFMLIATVAPFGHPRGANRNRFALIAPFEKDPGRWTSLAWTNFYEPGSRHQIAASTADAEDFAREKARDVVIVKTYRNVFNEYRLHPECKALGPDRKPCHKQTRGLLQRRPVQVATTTYIGKESNKLQEVVTGLVTDIGDVLNEYQDPQHDPMWELTLAALLALAEPIEQTAADAKLSVRTIKKVRAKEPVRAETQKRITRYTIRRAGSMLRELGIVENPRAITTEALLSTFLQHFKRRLCECGCARPLSGRQRYYDRSCRQAAYRERKAA